MPGTHAQNVMWAALDEQLPPARTGVPEALAEALAEVLADAVALVEPVALVAPPTAELVPPPLLHEASSVTAATPVIPATANRVVLLGELPFDNMGAPSLACCRRLVPSWGMGMAVNSRARHRVSG
jgi:hypothetical protein